MSKSLRLLLAIVAILLLVGAVLATREWKAPELGRAVLARAAELGGVDLHVDDVRFHLLRGVRLAGVRAVVRSPGGVVETTMEHLELRHRFGPLLGGRVVIDEVRLVRPALRLVPSGESVDRAQGAATGGGGRVSGEASRPDSETPSGLALSIERIVVVDASVTLESGEEGDAPTRLEGLDLELRDLALDPGRPTLVGLRGAGTIRAERVEADPLVGRDLLGDLTIGEGTVTLSSLGLDAAEGPVAADAVVLDLRREPRTFDVRGGSVAPIALAELLGSTAEGFGRAELRVDVRGDAESSGLDGGGRVTVAEGTLPTVPLIASLEALLGEAAISGRPYEAFELPFRLRGARLDLEPTEIRTPELRLGISGGADLAGAVDLRVALRFPRGSLDVEEIPGELLDLATDAEGFVHLHVALGGPIESPRASLDESGWKRTAREALERRAREEIEKGAAKLLRDLLGGDDEEEGDGGG